jgi:hypothetical protein
MIKEIISLNFPTLIYIKIFWGLRDGQGNGFCSKKWNNVLVET